MATVKKKIDEDLINKINLAQDKEPILILDKLSKKYGSFLAVNNVNIEVCKGETIGLVGPNGAGKTTIIKMLAKILRPTSGRILIRNKENRLSDLHKSRKESIKLGFLIDIPAFYDMTAFQLLCYFALLQNYPKENLNNRIDELLAQFKLLDWKHKKVKNFSKGMTQKLGIIQALIHDPDIIILDEPQSGLDPKARINIRHFIRNLQNQGKTIFVASHMLYEISEVCDKIALISHGDIIGFDTIDNLESSLKIKELKCQIIDDFQDKDVHDLLDRITHKLKDYLDKELDSDISDFPVLYNDKKHTLKIYYDGKVESRAAILKILIKDFDLNITAFTQPKASKLERIYSEMVIDDERDTKQNNKKWWKR
ncbi:MAG: ABC transporter ATP-binding protein [Candidatus Hermodarchaeota archaeon]